MRWILALNCTALRFNIEDQCRAGNKEGVSPSDTKQSSHHHCANTRGALCFSSHSSGLLIQLQCTAPQKSSCWTTSQCPRGSSDHGWLTGGTWGSFSSESSFWLHGWRTAQPVRRQLPPQSARITVLMMFSFPLIKGEVEQPGHHHTSEHLLPALSCSHHGKLHTCS